MSKWTGRMPTSRLDDRHVRPIEYRKWEHARRQFARGKDREKVDNLKQSIRRHGLQEPILLGISARYPTDVYVGDGHHRAVALMELGISEFPFRWYWIKSLGVHIEREPFPIDL